MIMKNFLVLLLIFVIVQGAMGQTVLIDNSEYTDYQDSMKSDDFTYLFWDRNHNGQGTFTTSSRPMLFYWDNDDSKFAYVIDTQNMTYLKSTFYSMDITDDAIIGGEVGIGMDPTSSILSISGVDDYYVPDLLINGANSLIGLGLGSVGPHGFLFGDSGSEGLQLVYRSTPNSLIVEYGNTGGDGEDLFSIDYDTKESYFKYNVGIGVTNPSYKLEVNGSIRSKEVVVEASSWPDYVFSDGYELASLSEIEAYIKSNRHLPGVPSAKEVENGGLSVGEMNAKLLEKIEELTLHVIRLEKEMEDLKKQNSTE